MRIRVTPVAYKVEQSVMGQKMCFSDIYYFLGREQNFLIISIFFRKKTRNSLFPQCKTSIGNNSDSIKDRVVKFAYKMGFSEMVDRMV